MANQDFSLGSDLDDDLPRTLRREREARERRAKERELTPPPLPLGYPQARPADVAPYADIDSATPPPARVTRIDVPFLHLVMFFIKAALAAIPALLLLGALLWLLGHVAQTYFPQLIKMQILIMFPRNS